jgi:hypothetical protein
MKRFLPRARPLSGPALSLGAMRLLVSALVLAAAAGLAFRPDARDALRPADALLAAGRYHAALGAYLRLADAYPDWAEASLRVGLLRALRGEHDAAVRALYTALAQGLRGARRDLASLYLGQALLRSGRTAQAADVWGRVPSSSPYAPPLRVLEGERDLARGSYAAAEDAYAASLTWGLPSAWRQLAAYRLTLLRGEANSAPVAEAPADESRGQVDTALLGPLLPRVPADSAQLAAVLRSQAPARAQLLGQLYLEQRLYGGALAQFSAVPPQGALGEVAALGAAYARMRSGDSGGAAQALERIVQADKGDAPARTLLALAYVAASRFDAAEQQVAALAAMPGQQEPALLAAASLASARRDYTAAADAYQRLLAAAPPAERGRYALLVAGFHLGSGYGVCGDGLDAADTAARLLPENPAALTALAGARLYCADAPGAALAARAALAHQQRPDAAYYLGAALAAQGQREAARAALIAAADLSPDSVWRERAERVLEAL